MTQNRTRQDVTHTTLSVLFIVLLAGATLWVLSPFLIAMLWAVIVSVATWPMLLWLERLLGGRRRLAVFVIMVAFLLVVFVPVTLAVVTIVDHAGDLRGEMRSFELMQLPPPPDWLVRVPLVGEWITDEWVRFAALGVDQKASVVLPYAQAVLQWFAARAGGLGIALIQFVLTAVITALALADGERVRDWILRFAERLAGGQGHEAAVLAARTIRGVVLGVVGTALVQAAIGGVGLFVAGVPAAPLLAAVTLFICLAQLGPLPVLIPCVAWLFWSGHTVAGSVLAVIALAAGTLDNIVRPILIKRGADLPLVLIFAGVIGGLVAFGIVGLFVGPVVLAVAHTLLTRWVWSADAAAPPGAVG
jgi:predicted PurR-regulated permease PerM